MNNRYSTFGDLKIGDTFVFFNPYYVAKPDLYQGNKVKISPRRYEDANGGIYHSSSKTGVAVIKQG